MMHELHTNAACPHLRIEGVAAGVERLSASLLRVRYTVRGDIAALALAPPSAPLRSDNLWKTTCFEAFLKPADTPGYRELNFSPSGRWAAYDFAGHRERIGDAWLPAAPDIALDRAPDRLDVAVTLSLDLPEEPYRLGLTAVIEEIGLGLSYWALGHGPGAPDFHHPACLVLELPPAPAP